MAKIEDLKAEAGKLLREGKVKYIIGYGAGTNGWPAAPLFITRPEESTGLSGTRASQPHQVPGG
jgi:hypothetical protein